MIRVIGQFVFDTFGGRALIGAAGLAALLSWWMIDKGLATRAAYNEGALHAKSGFEAESGRLADEMEDAARRADSLNTFERLRSRWCVDCGGR